MIAVEHLTKYYGSFKAVDDLSFQIEEGHVYGFLGPNGAGKSTTMNIMTGCLSATEGRVKIDGHDIFEEPYQTKKLIGYLPEQPPLYMNETPMEYLKFVGEAKGLRGEELKKQIEEAISRTKIQDVRNQLISKLSKGYKQRVGIAQALLGNPKVIILDEPTVGLDPLQIIEIRELIGELSQNHTVILSSHILSEVQAVCEKVLIIAKGKLIAFDTPEKLETLLLSSNEISFTAEASLEETKEILTELELYREFSETEGGSPEGMYGELQEETGSTEESKKNVEPAYDGKESAVTELTAAGNGLVKGRILPGSADNREISRKLFFAFAKKDRALLELKSKRGSLEDVFIELTENDTESGVDAE